MRDMGRKVIHFLRSAGAIAAIAALAACASQPPAPVLSHGVKPRAGAPNVAETGPVSGFGAPSEGRRVDLDGVATVAILAPLSDRRGQVRALGQALVNAADLALRDLGDPRLKLRSYDTQGDPAAAAAAAQAAVDDGAALIIGPLFATSVKAVRPVAESAGVNVIAFSTDATVAGAPVYLAGMLPRDEVDRILDYAAERGMIDIAAMAAQTPYGDVVVTAAGNAAAGNAAQISAVQRYTPSFKGIAKGAKDYARTHHSQAILLPAAGQELQTLSAYLAYYDVSPKKTHYLGLGGWNTPLTLKEATLRGGWFAAPDPLVTAKFQERYANAYGVPAPAIAGLGYEVMAAAGAMIADARLRGDAFPFSSTAITDSSGFIGVNGIFRFTADGLNQRGLAVLEVGRKGFEIIDPAPREFPQVAA